MKFSRKFSHRNLGGMFRFTLLIYGENRRKKYVSDIM